MAVVTMQAGKDSLLTGFISKYRADTFKYDILYHKQVIQPEVTKITIPWDGLLSKYRNELYEYEMTYTFTDEEYNKYAYNPKRLSYDLYGTTEFWDLILRLNELYSTSEFDLRTVKLYNGGFYSAITSIISAEQPFTNINEEEVTEALRATS